LKLPVFLNSNESPDAWRWTVCLSDSQVLHPFLGRTFRHCGFNQGFRGNIKTEAMHEFPMQVTIYQSIKA
jgi:hypothetical protein